MSEIRIAYHSSLWGDKNFLECLKDLADVGFKYVETFGDIAVQYYDKLYAFKGILGNSGIRLLAIRGQGEFINPEMREKEIGYNKSVCEFLADNRAPIFVLSGARPPQGPSPDDLKRLADFCNEIGEFCNYLQIKACIHAAAGRIVETRAEVDKIMELTEPRLVYLCPDIAGPACSGDNAAELIRTYLARIPHFYFKDLATAADAAAQPVSVELGRGSINLHAVVDALLGANYNGSITIELEKSGLAPRESAAANRKYIETELGLRVDPRPVPALIEEAAHPVEQKQPLAPIPSEQAAPPPPEAPAPAQAQPSEAPAEQQAPQPPEEYAPAVAEQQPPQEPPPENISPQPQPPEEQEGPAKPDDEKEEGTERREDLRG